MGAVIGWLAGFLRVFWVCRVSLVNVVVGVLFFYVVTQAQNLMADLSSWGHWATELTFWTGVFVFTFMLWAFPVHYGARRSLDQMKRLHPAVAAQQSWLIAQLPRALGLMPFLALALGIMGARDSAAGAAKVLPTAGLTMTQGIWLYVADAVAAIAFIVFVYLRRKIVPREWDGSILHPLAMAATAAIFAAAYVAPIDTSVVFPRALLVPSLFGSLVLAASWLTRLGDRTHFPFLATLALLLGLSTGLNAHFNDLRTLPGAAPAALTGDQRLDMDTAIAAWKAANECSDACPKPIIIAIDGGASRAAFTAATLVGDLLDHMPQPAGHEAPTPGRRIFAISGVSGGAYGAAVIQAALLEAQRQGDGMKPPCRSAQTTWFGFDAWQGDGNRFTWRRCLQALTSGDYLSSAIIGLAFRDFAAPPWQWLNLPAMADRAAILEMTWERQFAATLQPGRPFFEGGDRCHGDDDRGLCRRMAHPAAYLAPKGPTRWMPMLLLNGTSVTSGRRIIAADLASVKADGPPNTSPGSLFSQGYDLREAMSGECHDAGAYGPVSGTATCVATPLKVDGPDVRLSTAALTSARFPIISPAGVFHMAGTGYGDQVVDGGYFENSGLTTALDIVHALEQHGVTNATVVSISNDPAYAARDAGLPFRPATTPLLPPADESFLGRFVSLFYRPFQTLVATGDGHSDELLALIYAHPPGGGFYHLTVEVAPDFGPKLGGPPPLPDMACDSLEGHHMTMANVSMSWWLAAATQADLDAQRCGWENRVHLQEIVGVPAAAR